MSETTCTALVTGGGRGIGRAISERLAQEQPVVMVGRTEESLEEARGHIQSVGKVAEYVVGDVTEPATRQGIEQLLQDRNWEVSSLVLNAGIGKCRPVESFPEELFHKIFDVNLLSTLPLIQLVLPAMKRRRAGTICFINSTLGLKGARYDSAYTASKHAQIGMARSMAHDCGEFGISVVPICPGFVESEMTDRYISSVAERKGIELDQARAILEKTNPQRRIIPAEEVAEVVAFVCSGRVPSLSGSPLVMSGGGL